MQARIPRVTDTICYHVAARGRGRAVEASRTRFFGEACFLRIVLSRWTSEARIGTVDLFVKASRACATAYTVRSCMTHDALTVRDAGAARAREGVIVTVQTRDAAGCCNDSRIRAGITGNACLRAVASLVCARGARRTRLAVLPRIAWDANALSDVAATSSRSGAGRTGIAVCCGSLR